METRAAEHRSSVLLPLPSSLIGGKKLPSLSSGRSAPGNDVQLY